MNSIYRSRMKIRRLCIVLLAVVAYALLLVMDASRFFPLYPEHTAFSLLFLWGRFGFSALVAFMFLAVGAFVWLYARDRSVATPLFCFACTMMVTFAVETAAVSNDALSLALAGASSPLTFVLLLVLLLRFPKNYLAFSRMKDVFRVDWRSDISPLLPWFVIAMLLLSFIAAAAAFADYLFNLSPPIWLTGILTIYNVLVPVSILVTIIVSYLRTPSLRERQQRRIFVGSVILAILPFLLLTVLPGALSLPSQYILDPQISTLTVALLPVALGYTILRYQVLVFERYIRRAATWMVGAVGLAMLGYLIIMFSSILMLKNVTVYVVCAVIATLILAPCIWWLSHLVTDYFFFSEMRHYRRLIERADTVIGKSFDLDEAARLLTTAALSVFETQEVCLFILDTETGCYRPYPVLKEDEPGDAPRRSLVQRIISATQPASQAFVDWLSASEPIIERVAAASRPLMLHEASKSEAPRGLSRYISTTGPLGSTDPLLVGVHAHGKMIGLLVLGERSDHQQYAGPDFEAAYLLLARFSPLIETARLYAQATRITIALRAAYERQKELDRLKDQFIMTTSHELRTPLTAVQGYIELLSEHEMSLAPEVRSSFIAKARRGCDELSLMVNNIMDASRVEVEVEYVRLSPVPIEESVHHVLEILEAVIKRERREVKVNLPADLFVAADTMRLRQVLLNLLSNALKYSPAGSDIEITSSVDHEQQEVTLRIRDYGHGVPPADQERLFERFVRLERDMNSPVRGAGLGLYISKRLIEAMGGRIWIESAGIPGKGSTFAFALKQAEDPSAAMNRVLDQVVKL